MGRRSLSSRLPVLSAMRNGYRSRARRAAWYLVVLGTIVTGYLFFVVGLGVMGAFLPSWRGRSGTAFIPFLCSASVAYVGIALLLTRISETTLPIALGLIAGNILFMAYHLVRQRRVRHS